MSNTGARIAARFDLPRGLALVEPVVERRARRRDLLQQQDSSGAAVEERTGGVDDSAAAPAVRASGGRQEPPAAPRMVSSRPALIGAEENAPPGTAEPATVEKPPEAKDPAGERGASKPAAAPTARPSGTQRKPPAPNLPPPDRDAASPAPAPRKPQQTVAAPNVKPAGFPEAVGEHRACWELTASNPGGGDHQDPGLRRAFVRFPRAAPASDSPAHPWAAASPPALEPVPAGRSHPGCTDPDSRGPDSRGPGCALPDYTDPGRAGSLERHTPEGLTTPVRILSQPLPRYPAQALEQRLQGDVLVDVEFRYSGALEVLGVRQGLSPRLNESAVEAARQIRFLPARRDGRPVDTRATVCIRFQLDT